MQEGLREYLEKLRSLGKIELYPSINYADLSKIQMEFALKSDLLFVEQIEQYQYSFLTNLIASRERLAATLGSKVDSIHSQYLTLEQNPIEPTMVHVGRCQEVIKAGSEIDLESLPAVKFSREDISPYITAGLVVAKDPETGKRNVSIHRMQVKGKTKLGIRLEATSHLLKMQRKAEEKNRKLEVAIVIGNHPVELLASVCSLEYGQDEFDIAGAIRGEALEVVKCKTVDVEVPANAEIVIEGFIPPNSKETEGPFGDFMGFYVEPSLNHYIEVTGITTCENNPIFQSIRAGSREDALLLGFAKEITIYKELLKKGFQVKKVNLSPMVFICTVSIEKRHDNEPREIIDTIIEIYPWLKYCIVVDEDVDCYDLNDVWWAVGARSTPAKIKLLTDRKCFPRDPHNIHLGKVGIDATVPYDLKHYFRRAIP